MGDDDDKSVLSFSFLGWLDTSNNNNRRDPPERVQMKRSRGKVVNQYDLYIGRRCARGGWKLSESKWHNPKKYRSLDRYRKHVETNPELMEALGELLGKRIGCFCKPEAECHADVLIELCKEMLSRDK